MVNVSTRRCRVRIAGNTIFCGSILSELIASLLCGFNMVDFHSRFPWFLLVSAQISVAKKNLVYILYRINICAWHEIINKKIHAFSIIGVKIGSLINIRNMLLLTKD